MHWKNRSSPLPLVLVSGSSVTRYCYFWFVGSFKRGKFQPVPYTLVPFGAVKERRSCHQGSYSTSLEKKSRHDCSSSSKARLGFFLRQWRQPNVTLGILLLCVLSEVIVFWEVDGGGVAVYSSHTSPAILVKDGNSPVRGFECYVHCQLFYARFGWQTKARCSLDVANGRTWQKSGGVEFWCFKADPVQQVKFLNSIGLTRV